MAKRAAIYCRISSDPTGLALGVERQRKDSEEFCQRRGWDVVDVLVDNDVSAFSGKARPEYRRLCDGIHQGTYDAVVVWHPDRLHRSLAELETFINLVEETHVSVATVTAGNYDLTTPEGRLTARIVGSVARKESEDKSRRLRRKHLELAENGKLSGGGRRPFGYEADRLTIRESEAAEIRTAVARVLSGESVRSVAVDWRERGVPTVTGASWSPTTVKRLLMSGRISGQREHKGVIVGPATWPAIIDPNDTIQLRAILGSTERVTPGERTARSYLLSGFLFCGECGTRMTARPVIRKGHRYRRYACTTDRGGCGRVGITAERIEEFVSEAAFHALDGDDLSAAVAEPDAAPAGEDPSVEIERRRAELAEMWAAGELSKAEWTIAREALDARLADVQRTVVEDTRSAAAARYAGHGDELRTEWPDMTLDARRAVLSGLIDTVFIAGTTKADNKFNPDRLTITWKV